jgi:hypothetical protein
MFDEDDNPYDLVPGEDFEDDFEDYPTEDERELEALWRE